MEYLQKARPRVLFISLDGADGGGHSRRYDNYLRSARLGDELLGMLWEKLQSMEQYAGTTTLIVTTDHGRGDPPDDWRSHGKDVTGSELMWFAALGPGVPALGERADTATLTQSQVAATVAALLGLDYRATVPQAAPPIEQIVGQSR
jgi:arylsulfatase A-like enzyme